MKKVAIGFLGNIFYDTRTFNLHKSLKEKGHEVYFIGFDWLTEEYQTIDKDNISVKKLNKGRLSFLFYIKFFVSQLKSLIKIKSDIYFAADFFSLPAVFFAAKIRQGKIFYDSREIYTELPFHENKPSAKKIFRIIEGYLIKKVDRIFTTGEMDSRYLEKIYPFISTVLLRNLPLKQSGIAPVDYFLKYNLPENSIVILYQGIVIKGRGFETYFKALKKMPDLYLIILGGGEHLEFYKTLANEMKISGRVIFEGKIPQNKIMNYTSGAFAGLSLINNISINNYYALPNKLFEYVMSGLPVIVNDLPQMKKVIEEYKVGEVLKEINDNEIISTVKKWRENKSLYSSLKENCFIASQTLNWETEFQNVYHLFN